MVYCCSGVGVASLHRLPLEGLKIKIKRNLKLLEAEKLVSAENDYQELINAIAKVHTYQQYTYMTVHLCK